MSDLISRQALIEHLRRTIEASSNDGDYNEGFNDGMDFAACFASTLPSAQPETCAYWDKESNLCALHRPSAQPDVPDTIYRQAAIDTVRKCSVKEVTPAYMLINKEEVVTELMMLPSAQTLDAQEAYYKGKIDAFSECMAVVKRLNEGMK